MEAESRAVLKRFKPSVIAVTGSVGKTSTKDAIFTVFSGFVQARKSEKSFNSEIGVPLTVLGLKNAWSNPLAWVSNLLEGIQVIFGPNKYPKWLVLEVGADRPGDIKKIASWVKPSLVVLTRFPDVPVHVEYFSSPQKVAEEKLSLVDSLQAGGKVIANGDDLLIVDGVKKRGFAMLTYGFSDKAEVRGENYEIVYEEKNGLKFPVGFSLKVFVAGESLFLTYKGSLGRHHAYPLLAALATAHAVGFDIRKVADRLASHASPPGRMKLLEGKDSSVIIDDSYNSSPVAAKEALQTLSALETSGRKIVAFGDMLELGKYSIAEHELIGKEMVFADLIIVVGLRARGAGEIALKMGKSKESVVFFADSASAADYLSKNVSKGDIVLVKGSQGARMERVSAALLVDPKIAKDALVRQEEEWGRR